MFANLPDYCFDTLSSTGELIIIKRGEAGYYTSSWNTQDRSQNEKIAATQNEKLGISEAQVKAMSIGSLFGWDVPGADPALYEKQKNNQQGLNDLIESAETRSKELASKQGREAPNIHSR